VATPPERVPGRRGRRRLPAAPQQRGHRGDERLTAVSNALTDRGSTAFGSTTVTGTKDTASTDADNTVGWAVERYERVGLFGFSFGGRSRSSRRRPAPTRRVCALAPTARLNPDVDAVAVLDDLIDLSVPTRILYATRDSTADWEPVVERAKELGIETIGFESDHFFVGRAGDVGRKWGRFSGRD